MTTRRLAYILIGSSLILLALSSLFAHGADADARARAALSLAQASYVPHTTCDCGVNGVNDCDCTDGCQCPPCQEKKDAKLYQDAYNSSLETQRQVVFWVGDCYCGPCRFKLKQAIHCRLAKWFGSDKSGVIVCRPVNGKLIVVQSWGNLPDVEDIQAALSAPTPYLYVPPDRPVIVGGGGCVGNH